MYLNIDMHVICNNNVLKDHNIYNTLHRKYIQDTVINYISKGKDDLISFICVSLFEEHVSQ